MPVRLAASALMVTGIQPVHEIADFLPDLSQAEFTAARQECIQRIEQRERHYGYQREELDHTRRIGIAPDGQRTCGQYGQ